jgi:hypothetical protein
VWINRNRLAPLGSDVLTMLKASACTTRSTVLLPLFYREVYSD